MFQIPRGTRDFTYQEMYERKELEESMRATFESFGYKEVQTPTFETLELFIAKSGEGIIDELYSFKDKGGRDLALRPELTAPVMRFYVEKMQMEPKPLKLFYFGNCFRYDRPQKGRYREFMQAGCELIGADTPEAKTELIVMAYKILENAGLKDINLSIGNLKILSIIFEQLNLTSENKKYITPLIDKALFEDVFDALIEFGVKPTDATGFVDIIQETNIQKINEYVGENKDAVLQMEQLTIISNQLKNVYNVKNFEIKLSIVRGLDYYSGLVFEIEAPKLGAEKQICGGGSYKLIELFGGRDVPTSGFAIGFDRTLIALKSEEFVFSKPKIDVYVVPVTDETLEKSLEIAQILRDNGKTVDVDLLRRGIGKSLKYASSINAQKAIIVGKGELEQNSVAIKDMKTGKQEIIKVKEILEYM